jgi:hypothetical protein
MPDNRTSVLEVEVLRVSSSLASHAYKIGIEYLLLALVHDSCLHGTERSAVTEGFAVRTHTHSLTHSLKHTLILKHR